MPQLQAAKKALRVSKRKRTVNDRWRRKMRDALNEIREALTANNRKAAEEAFQKAESVLDRAARRSILHPNKVARKKSRLKRAVSAIK
ncbi:MAG: 30S ribosomal protein S20 [Candidatus Andersenbacteria bacterium]